MKRFVLFGGILTLTIGWMMLIFGFSAQSGEESSGLSAIVAEPIALLLSDFRGGVSSEEWDSLYRNVDGAIRITAHFCEYAVLGGLLMLLFRSLRVRTVWLPWFAGTLYALTDEWHQSFSPGRVCDPTDVFIDTAGAIFGVVLCNKIIQIWRKKHVHNS